MKKTSQRYLQHSQLCHQANDGIQSATNAYTEESQRKPGRELDFLFRELKQLQESNRTWTVTEQVILKAPKIALGRETHQIAKNLPVADPTDPESLLELPDSALWT